MAGYEGQNKSVIYRAFARLRKSEEAVIREGMYGLLDAALEWLHEAHEEWMHHENENDTLGWALIHDGNIVEAVSQSKGEWTPNGDALGRLQAIASEVPSGAWTGVVLSDMANNWYRVDWEMGFLTYSKDEVKSHFHQFFKPIAA